MNQRPASPLHVAVLLFRWQRWGGLQRDALAVTQRCLQRGHRVTLLCLEAREVPLIDHAHFELRVLGGRGLAHHQRYASFVRRARQALAALDVDVTVGFNRMPGLDLHVAADPSYVARAASRSVLYRCTPRHRMLSRLERSVFEATAHTRVLLFTEAQGEQFRRCHGTPRSRLRVLAPALADDRAALPADAGDPAALRQSLGVPQGVPMLLMLATDAVNKGVDRAIRALAAQGDDGAPAHLVAAGPGAPARLVDLARHLGIADRVHLLAPRDDVPELLAAADVLLHPARRELAGQVLIEALAAAVPVITTAACGYARHVQDSGGGVVLLEPFRQGDLDAALGAMLDTARCASCADAARTWSAQLAPGALHDAITDEIESLGGR